jgi:phage-related baseplate assembly protein
MTQTPPTFIQNDVAAQLGELINQYQALAGVVLAPGQPERLILNAVAYREALLRQAMQDAAVQNLVAFARAPAIDYLGELVGVTRQPSAPAICTIQFTLVAGHTGIVIPANTRVASADGKVFFSTTDDITVAPGVLSASVEAFASPAGVIGNGFASGEIKNILDPLPYLLAAANTATTVGGADDETDDQLRERIRLAPGSFSTAGSRGAYVFHTKSASTLILDVAVTRPTPGTVQVYPLVAGGTTPGGIIALVEATLNDETVRPLTDTVIVTSPTVTSYEIEVEIVAYTGQDIPALQADIEAALNSYKTEKPATDLIIGPTTVAVCTGVTVTITSTTNG